MATVVLMYDGINSLAAGIARQFPGAAKVAGYINGIYAWSQAEWNLFPHADHVTISVRASWTVGDVLDVERGDATPDEALGWIMARRAAGLCRPTIYCSRSVIPAVRAATGVLLLGKDYDIWVADYTGSPHQVTAPGPGTPWQCVATQYESTANWDASVVYDLKWPHRVPPGLAAPGGLSGTPHVTGNLSWAPVDGVKQYEVDVAEGTPAAPGKLIAQPVVSGTHALGLDLGLPAPAVWRVRALPSGQWSPWKVLER
jgi:hypothetical protein